MSGRATADLCDTDIDVLRVAAPIFGDFGGTRCFEGPVTTVKVFEDTSLVRSALEEPGAGRVLVVDGGSLRCALVGDMLALIGQQNDWSGILVHGCIRDSMAVAKIAIGVKALATNPRKSVKEGVDERDVEVQFADVTIRPRDYIYADEDGVVVAERAIT